MKKKHSLLGRRAMTLVTVVALVTPAAILTLASPAAATSVPGTPGTPSAVGMQNAAALRWTAPTDAGSPPLTQYRVEKNSGAGWSTATTTQGAQGLTSGNRFTCALLHTGVVKCWGDNGNGELGLGNTAHRGDGAGEMGDNLPAVDLGSSRTAVALTGGDFHTCALLDNGSVKCWGWNVSGQLGLGDTASRGDNLNEMGDNLPAVDLGTSRTAVAIDGGADYTSALLDDATVKCWGNNSSGQLGQGDTTKRGDNASEMGDNLPAIDLGTGRTAVAIVASNNGFVCALLDNASVKCWGNNNGGALGLGNTTTKGDNASEMGDNLPAVNLGTGRTATAIAAGADHTCAILDDATTKCWGFNTSGQLGLGNTTSRGDSNAVGHQMGDSLPAVDLGSGRTATAISAGTNSTCVLLDDASVKCWGNNGFGQLGQGNTTNRGDTGGAGHEMGSSLPAVDLGAGRTATALATGGNHTCVLLDDATIKCWGYNGFGQLGKGNTTNLGDGSGEMGDNLTVLDLGSIRTVTAVAMGQSHTCALLDDGAVKCWGRNAEGELGLGDTASRGDGAGEMGDNLPAVDLGTGRTATAIAAGDGLFTCALLDDGSVKCWGKNDLGQLGLGDTTTRGDNAGEMGDNLPIVQLGTGVSATAIAVGYRSACALLDDDTLKCWGFNGFGNLGLGDTNYRGDNAAEMGNSLPAVDLGTGRTATAVTIGTDHTCALLDDATVKCWGYGNDGQLGYEDQLSRGDGSGEMGNSLPAVALGSGRTATAIDAGDVHTCALLDDATVKCWGRGVSGRLGLGNTTSRGDSSAAGHQMGDSLPAVDLGTGRTATAITAGTDHTCAVLDNATVKCWGFGLYGALGTGDTTGLGDNGGEMGDNLLAIDLGTGRTTAAISASFEYTCAVLDNGKLKCFGDNDWGQLGKGDTANRGDAGGEMGDNLTVVSLGGPSLYGAPARAAVVPLAANSYQLRVVAVNSVGDSSPSSASSSVTVTGAGVPGAPTSVGGTPGYTQVTLTWTAPASDGGSAITDYEVTVYNASGGPPLGVTGATTRLVGSATTNLVFTGLTNGTTYTFKVAAVNSFGTGAQSALSAPTLAGSFEVPATAGDPDGYDTGFVANNSVTLSASGTWDGGVGPFGPGGDSGIDPCGFGCLEPDAAPAYALVGRIGTSGSWTKIGTGPATLHGNGEVYLAMNDSFGLYGDNSGSVTASIVAELNLSQSYSTAGPIMAGPDVGWQAAVSNNGATTLTNVTFIAWPAFQASKQISAVPVWKSSSSPTPTPCPLVGPPNNAPNLYYCAVPSLQPDDTVEVSTTIHTLGLAPQTLSNAFVLNYSDQTGGCFSVIQCSSGFPVADQTSLVVDGLLFHITAPATVAVGTPLHIEGYVENTSSTNDINKIATFSTIDKGSVTSAVICTFENKLPLGSGATDRCPDTTFDQPAGTDSSAAPASVDINTTGLAGKTITYTTVGTSPDLGGNTQTVTGSIFVTPAAGGIAIQTPVDNATLARSVANDFTAFPTPSAASNVTSVDLSLDLGTPVNVIAPGPYTTQFAPDSLPAGTHTLTATMHQDNGPDTYQTITVKVANVPAVTIVQPAGFPPNSSLTAAKSFSATVTPGTGATIKSVVWQIDGTTTLTSAAASPYTALVDPAKLTLANGSHTLTATATDSVGQTTTSATFSFMVPTATLTMGTATRLATSVTPGGDAAWTVTVNNSAAAIARHVTLTFTAVATDTMDVVTPLSFDTPAINGALKVPPSTPTCQKGNDGISLVCTVSDLGTSMSVQFPLFALTKDVSNGSTITATAVAKAANSSATAPQNLGDVTVDSCGTNCVKGVAAAGTAFKNDTNPDNKISVNLSKGLQSTVHGVKFGRPFKRGIVGKRHGRVTLRPRLDSTPSIQITLDSYDPADSPTSPDAAMDASLCPTPATCLGDISKVDGNFAPYTNRADPIVVVIVARWGTTVPPGHIWMQKPPPLAHPEQIPAPIQLPACTINASTRAFNTPCVLPEITKTLTVNSVTTKTTYSTVLFTGNDPHMARR